jgi:hypothetical protein
MDDKLTTHKRRENNNTSGKARAEKARKRAEAEARKAARDMKTTAQQIAELDMMFGVGQGAANERARLANPKLAKKIEAAPPADTVVPAAQ